MEQPTAEPTKEVLAEGGTFGEFHCMALQCSPQMTTFHPGTHLPLLERQLTEKFCKLAVGTSKGSILVFSTLPSFQTQWQREGAHSKAIWALDWNPVVPAILASGAGDECINLWRMDHNQPLLSIQLDGRVLRDSLKWLPSSSTTMAVLLDNDSVYLFDLAVDQTRPVAVIEEGGGRWRLAFHSFKPLLLAGCSDGRGFELFELLPNPMIKTAGGARSLSLARQLEAIKLQDILKV